MPKAQPWILHRTLVFCRQFVYTSQVFYRRTGYHTMNYIVLDLEWNQCPTGKKHEIPHLPFEIIEIGAVKLNTDFQIIDQFQEVIRPVAYRTLHFRTKEIVHLTAAELKAARGFPEVITDFFAWCGEEPLFCIWGSCDLMELQRNLSFHQMPSPFAFPLIYYDIQKIFSIVYEDRKTRRSLETAIELLQLPKNVPFHNAFSDAYYTTLILQQLEPASVTANSSVDYYRTPRNRRQEIYLNYETYTKFISKPFDTRISVLKDRVAASTVCPLCGHTLQKKIRWFPTGSRNYCCLAFCREHGYLKGKLRIRQREDGRYYAIKTQKLISETAAYEIYEKKEILKLKRKLKKNLAEL